MVDGSSLLIDLDGVVVESVQRLGDGIRVVPVLTAPEWVGICPELGERSIWSKGWAYTSPPDVQVGPDRPLLRWRRRKWLCPCMVCDRKVFAEAVPGIPARARVAPRAKAMMDTAVLAEYQSVAAVAGQYRCGWHTVHDHFRAARLGLPQAIVIADRFHLVKKAYDMVDAVRQQATWTQRGRRRRKMDVEWINRCRLPHGAERLTAAQRARLFVKLLSADSNEDIAAAWIAKELLRELLSCADRGGLRYEIHAALDHLPDFYHYAGLAAAVGR